MISKITFLLFVLAMTATLGYCDTLQLDVASWSLENYQKLKQATREEIAGLLNAKLPANWDEISPELIGSYRWIDADADKNLELFVTLASSRHFLNQLLIFTSSNSEKKFLQDITVWNLNNLDLAIKDLDKDGYSELLLPQELSYYRAAGAMPIWTSIYRWRDGKFVKADSDYINFYKDKLPSLEFKIDSIRKEWEERKAGLDPEAFDETRLHYDRLAALQIIVRDKILRLIGPDSKIGYKLALEWSKSIDPEMRENAILVFKDIFDKNSQRELELLTRDSDPAVARKARSSINEHTKIPTNNDNSKGAFESKNHQ